LVSKNIYYRLYDDFGNERGPDYVYLHHIIAILDGVSSVVCPGNYPFFGAGAELVDIYIPDGYIFGLLANQPITYQIDLMNHDHHMARNVTIVQTIEYYILDGTENLKNVEIYLLSVNGCTQDMNYPIPIGPVGQPYIQYLDFPSTVDGTLVWMQGHLHMGGVDIYLMNTETLEVYFNSLPKFDENGFVIDMDAGQPMIHIPLGVPMRLLAIYGQTNEELDAMGVILGFVEVTKRSNTLPKEQLGNGNPVQSISKHTFGPMLMIIFGIFIGIVFVLLIIGAIVGFRLYRKKKQQSKTGAVKYTLGAGDDDEL